MKLQDIVLEDFSTVTDADDAMDRLVDMMSKAYNGGSEPPYDPVRYDRDKIHIRVPYRDKSSNDTKQQLDIISRHIGVGGERLRPDRTNAYVYLVTTSKALADWKRNSYPSSDEQWQGVSKKKPTELALSNKDAWKQEPDQMSAHVASVERAEKAAEAGRKAAKDMWTPGTELYKQRVEAEERRRKERDEDDARRGIYGPSNSLLNKILVAREIGAASIGPQLSKRARKQRDKKATRAEELKAELTAALQQDAADDKQHRMNSSQKGWGK